MNRYFILGTDTDCGKTYVTCQLLQYFKQKHHRAIGLKPIASGCGEQLEKLVSSDEEALQQFNDKPKQVINRWRFKPPISPHIAAMRAGVHVSIQEILDFCFDPRFDEYDYQLIEGAGGLMVPLNRDHTWVDFLRQSKIPVILVVGMTLGCINHALLTGLALQHYQISCVGWVANCIDPTMLEKEENIETLKTKLEFPWLTTISLGGVVDHLNMIQASNTV